MSSATARPVRAEVEARLVARLCTVHAERVCPTCHRTQLVAEPRVQAGPGVVQEDPTSATIDFLRRHPEDPDAGPVAVEVLQSLVDMVSCLGSRDLPRTLGHPAVLHFVERHTRGFVCPACDPRGFGLSRAWAASVMCRGSLNFAPARRLVEDTLALVTRAADAGDTGAEEAVDNLLMVLRSAQLEVSSLWFARWDVA